MAHTDRLHDTQKSPTAPDHLAREVARLVDPLAQASLISPEDAEVTLDLHLGQVGVLPFRPGLTPDYRAWSGSLAWAALILYPRTPPPVQFPIAEEQLARDAANAKAYAFHASLFTTRAWHDRSTFQLVDHLGPDDPGVFWINLADASEHGDLEPYRIPLADMTS
ncbi:hypothetical protein [Actinomadura violacea]|uniref:DUF1963 domain-containing protein n=1 Tax=Actinomadura violacea TaxID=2819934 RepID=A0ABS3SC17_9ACTN|nr:hypothetical protein [Actinomadura violacea]MBO2465759.1 hypothetical protein [Actinomadura violacea]